MDTGREERRGKAGRPKDLSAGGSSGIKASPSFSTPTQGSPYQISPRNTAQNHELDNAIRIALENLRISNQDTKLRIYETTYPSFRVFQHAKWFHQVVHIERTTEEYDCR